jgi:hypothetical protein
MTDYPLKTPAQLPAGIPALTDLLMHWKDGGLKQASVNDVLELVTAAMAGYDNVASGLTATTVQAALDELDGAVENRVRHDAAQGLAALAMQTARDNIGAQAAATAVRHDGQSLTASQQAAVRKTVYAAAFDAEAYQGLQINGMHAVSQENGDTAVTGIGARRYVTDAWDVTAVGPVVSGQRVTAPFATRPDITHGLKVVVTTAKEPLAAGDFIAISHRIEGHRVARLMWGNSLARPVAVGFMLRSNIALTGYLSARNSVADRSFVRRFTLAANTDTFVPLTIPGDTAGTWLKDNGTGINLTWAFACGTTFQTTADAWQIGNFLAGADVTNLGAALNNEVAISGLVVLPGLDLPAADRIGLVQPSFDLEFPRCRRLYHIQRIILIASGDPLLNAVSFQEMRVSSPSVTLVADSGTGGTMVVSPPNLLRQSALHSAAVGGTARLDARL